MRTASALFTRLLSGLLIVAAACSSSEPLQTACVDGDVRCGKSCSATEACPEGLYCNSSNACAKQCVVSKIACAGGGACMPNGMCPAAPAGAASGAGASGGAAAIPGAGRSGGAVLPPSGSATAGGSGVTACVNTTAKPTRVMPTVILVVDQSGSMNETFGDGTRWEALRDSLISEPNGLVTSLQGQVSFGLALYSARAEEGPVTGMCPLLQTQPPTLNNRSAIAQVYSSASPIDETPTGDAIDAIATQLVPAGTDLIATPYAFILATDGEPDSCEDPNPDEMARTDAAKQRVVDAVTRAHQRGIRTYVISVGDDLSEDHQRAVANAGVGHVAGTPDAQFWRAGDDQSLRASLMAIVGTQISCDIALNGMVQGDPCRGTVTLQGAPLVCNGPNGWSLIDPGHIRLAGTACQSLSSDQNATLNISFPCDVFLQ